MRLALLAALITALAAVLRTTSPDHGLPCDPEPDLYMVRHVERLKEHGLGDRYLAGWRYPLLFGTVTAALAADKPLPPPDASLEEHLRAASADQRLLRRVVAWISILGIPLTFLLALRFTTAGAAAFAAALLATSGLHTWYSLQARPHAPTGTLVLLALITATRWVHSGKGRDGVFAGLAAGLAGAALHSGLAAGLSFGVSGILVLAKKGRSSLPAAALGGGLALGAVVWGYGLEPHEPRDWHLRETSFLEKTGADANHVAFGGHLMRSDRFDGGGFGVLANAFSGMDPVLGALSCLGLLACVVALVRRNVRASLDRPAVAVTLATLVPSLAVFGAYGLSYERFFLPLFPLFAIVAATGARAIAVTLRMRPVVAVGLGSALLALPLATSSRIAWLVTQTRTHDQLTRSIQEKAAANDAHVLLVHVRPLPDWCDDSMVRLVPRTYPNRWLTHQARVLEEHGDVPKGVDARGVAFAAYGRDGAPAAEANAIERFLGEADRELVALATTWQPITVERADEIEAWRNGLRLAGYRPAGLVAPFEQGKETGRVPALHIGSLFRRRALGDRYELYVRGG